MELFRMNDTGDEINPADCLDVDDKDYQNTPARRQHAEVALTKLQEDSHSKDMRIKSMEDNMDSMAQQTRLLNKS